MHWLGSAVAPMSYDDEVDDVAELLPAIRSHPLRTLKLCLNVLRRYEVEGATENLIAAQRLVAKCFLDVPELVGPAVLLAQDLFQQTGDRYEAAMIARGLRRLGELDRATVIEATLHSLPAKFPSDALRSEVEDLIRRR